MNAAGLELLRGGAVWDGRPSELISQLEHFISAHVQARYGSWGASFRRSRLHPTSPIRSCSDLAMQNHLTRAATPAALAGPRKMQLIMKRW